MQARNERQQVIAIIGGGLSGALTAYHLVNKGLQARVVIIDPRRELGLGLAYSTPSLKHLLNVPAGKISAIPEEPLHFLHWLRSHHDPHATASTFAPRAVFGRYIQFLLSTTPAIDQLLSSVIAYKNQEQGVVLFLADGSQLEADRVVLATGNFDPAALPNISEEAKAAAVYCHDAWNPSTYAALAKDAPVTLIGTGLTSIDVLLRFRELGHTGSITAISRHGILPARHADYLPMTSSAIPASTPATCRSYLRAFRTAIRNGADWRAAVDSLRPFTNDLWLALSFQEQKRFRRHLQRRWDVVRHRMAPPIADQIESELKAGTLIVRKGSLEAVEFLGSKGAEIKIRSGDQTQSVLAARIVNCTGPSMDYRKANSPLLASLFAAGLVSSGPLGGGFHCSRSGAMIDAEGRESGVLFNVGPGRLGTLLESIAVPEIRDQAAQVATEIITRIQKPRRPSARHIFARSHPGSTMAQPIAVNPI